MPYDPKRSYHGLASLSRNGRVNPPILTPCVGIKLCRRLRFRRLKENGAQLAGVLLPEAQSRAEQSGLVLAARMVRVQAIVA